MSTIDWKVADGKLRSLMGGKSKLDVYMVANILIPLRHKYDRGERSVRLYNTIMSLDTRALMEGIVFPRREPSAQLEQTTFPPK